MTGNIVLLGFGIAGSAGLPVVAPLVSLAAFLIGSAVGGMLAATTADRHAQHVARALGIEVGLVLAAAIVAAAADVRPSTFSVTRSSRCSRWPWECATPPSGGWPFPTSPPPC